MRCATRKTYQKQVKIRDKHDKQIWSEKIAESFLQSDSRDFWSEMSKLRDKKKPVSTTVNCKNNNLDIACCFFDHYNDLFKWINYNIEEKDNLYKKVCKDSLYYFFFFFWKEDLLTYKNLQKYAT